jgi:hypothetical protein
MWFLILIAVNVNNPEDQPAWVRISFDSEPACRLAAANITYWIKFKNFRIDTECKPSPSSPTTLPTK